MARLNNPRRETLSLEDFEKFPVWTWDDQNEGYLPISETNPSPENYWGLFIKAKFTSPGGQSFDGYLVGDHDFHAFGLFVYNEDFVFNVNLSGFIDQLLKKIYNLLKSSPFPLFPLRYKSPIDLEDGSSISGKFVMKSGELFCIPDLKQQ